MHSKPTQKILIGLDIAMITLILLASFILVFDSTEHFYLIIGIMFAYLYYFVRARFQVYFGKRDSRVIREIPGRNGDNVSGTRSVFTEEYQRREFQKSRREIPLKNNDDSLNNSNFSYMNRSKRANQSLSRSIISSNTIHISDFDFLGNREEGTNLLRDSFVGKFRGLDDSYIKNVKSHEKRQEDISSQMRKNMTECTSRYLKTLQKLHQTPTSAHPIIKNLQKLSLTLCKQSYRQNIQNLKNLIQILTQIYQIKISCKQIPELDNICKMVTRQKEEKLDISLAEVLGRVGGGQGLGDVGVRVRNRGRDGLRGSRQEQRLTRKVYESASVISQENKAKIKKLMAQHEKLCSYFYNQNRTYLSPEQYLAHVQILRQYIQQQQSQQSQYELITNTNISQQHSERLLIGFNITKNKLNELIPTPQHHLQYPKKSYLGWLKRSPPSQQYQIKQTLNSDNGHPHYDLLAGKEVKQEYACQYGRNNGYCLLWVFLVVLVKQHVEVVRGNKGLEAVYNRWLGIYVL